MISGRDKNIIVIGSSTGGPKALNKLFGEFPMLNALVVVVQHVPPYFDQSIANRLNDLSVMPVSLAAHGEAMKNAHAYFAPANLQMSLKYNYKIDLQPGDKVNCCIPSVDVTMTSLHKNGGGKLVGVILTGMGRDGADGIVHMKKLGAATIAQSEESCTIYGMPKAAVETGHVDNVLHLDDITFRLVELVGTVE